jgi:phosphoglycolate phosphatase-like HAD superfamily hydrolase
LSTSSPYDLVIFDCDGVLVDSEALACVVHAEVLTEYGYAITAEQVHERFLGRSAREARLEVEGELGRVLPDTYTAHLRATIDRVFGEKLTPVPHIAETLGKLSQRICVASSGTPTRIRSSLGTTGLTDFFAPHLFSAMQVERGKPAGPVPVCRRANDHAARAMSCDRGLCARRHRRCRRRDDGDRIYRRQPLPPRRRTGCVWQAPPPFLTICAPCPP